MRRVFRFLRNAAWWVLRFERNAGWRVARFAGNASVRVAMLLWIPAKLVFLISLIVSVWWWGRYAMEKLPWAGASPITSADQYELFRDILFLWLTVAGVTGIIVWWFLRRTLSEYVREEARREVIEHSRVTYISLGLLYWKQGDIEEAKRITAWATVEKPPLFSQDMSGANIAWAKNNLAYYNALQHREKPHWSVAELSVKLAEEAAKKYNPNIPVFNRPTWLETEIFVKASFASTQEQARELIHTIEKLLADNTLQAIHEDLNRTKAYLTRS